MLNWSNDSSTDLPLFSWNLSLVAAHNTKTSVFTFQTDTLTCSADMMPRVPFGRTCGLRMYTGGAQQVHWLKMAWNISLVTVQNNNCSGVSSFLFLQSISAVEPCLLGVKSLQSSLELLTLPSLACTSFSSISKWSHTGTFVQIPTQFLPNPWKFVASEQL